MKTLNVTIQIKAVEHHLTMWGCFTFDSNAVQVGLICG